MLPLIGAGMAVGGAGLNAYGQQQALDAMRGVWGDARAKQAGYDNQINDIQQRFLSQVNPSSVMGSDTRAQVGGQMDASARNVMAAAQKQAGRRRGNAEGKAVAQQAQGGILAQLLRSGQLAAMLQGIQAGGQNIDMLGRQAGMDTNLIRGNAQQAASLVPMFENAAAMKGSWARQGGTLLGQLGQGAMSYGMSMPAGGGATSSLNGAPYGSTYFSEMPANGWGTRMPAGSALS